MDLLLAFALPGQVGMGAERPLSYNCPQQCGSVRGALGDALI